ncbi:MAG: NAD(P)/FAD-dependent oxidoreductase [Oscillospiraceae bacterium]|nr:NAD(P)/FAD-dependent oxidoreductase [Oscillospiraceae bacterium]
MNNQTNADVIIIGGGVSGFTTAYFLKQSGLKTLLFSGKISPLKKLSITGKGRCNLTNDCDVDTVLQNIFKNSAFMRSSLNAFPPESVMQWVKTELKIPLKTERGGRVFPCSDKASDIVEALQCSHNTQVVSEGVAKLLVSEISDSPQINGVKTSTGIEYYAPKILIATGGVSYPKTGSTGDGHSFAKQVGHSIVPLNPALVPFETSENCSDLAGLSLKNVRLTFGKFVEQGEMLFTHFGVSGPLVLTASCFSHTLPHELSIDLKPALDAETLDRRLLREFSENKNRQLKNILPALLPEKLIKVFGERSGLSEKRACEISREERRNLLELFKNFRLTVIKLRPMEEAVITNGGVNVKEVNPKTMQSKIVKGLYFAGEVLDIAAFTGGFNLQIAFSTAFAAARGIEMEFS